MLPVRDYMRETSSTDQEAPSKGQLDVNTLLLPDYIINSL